MNDTALSRWLTQRTLSLSWSRPQPSLRELIDSVAAHLGIHSSELRSISRGRYRTLARALIAWHATNGRIATLTEAVRHFNRDPSTLSSEIAGHLKGKPELFRYSLYHFFSGTPEQVANGKD